MEITDNSTLELKTPLSFDLLLPSNSNLGSTGAWKSLLRLFEVTPFSGSRER